MKFLTFLAIFAFVGAALCDEDSEQVKQLHNTVDSLEELVIQINVQYESSRINKNVTQLMEIVNQIKQFKGAMHQEEVVINSAISSADYFSFVKRVDLEMVRIKLQHLEKALDTIAFEILGFQAGVTELPTTFISQPLSLTLNVLRTESKELAASMNKVESAIEDAMKEHPVKMEKKSVVMLALSEVSGKAAHLQAELYSTYILVVEQANLDSRELDVVQKMRVEYFINSLQYFMHFTKEFSELFDRLVAPSVPTPSH